LATCSSNGKKPLRVQIQFAHNRINSIGRAAVDAGEKSAAHSCDGACVWPSLPKKLCGGFFVRNMKCPVRPDHVREKFFPRARLRESTANHFLARLISMRQFFRVIRDAAIRRRAERRKFGTIPAGADDSCPR